MSAKEMLPAAIKLFYRGIKTPELRKSFLELYFYIRKMSEDFDVKITDLELLDIFGVNTREFPTRSEINKKLFELAKKANDAKTVNDFHPEVVKSMVSSYFNKNTSKDALLNSIRNLANDITNYHRHIMSNTKEIHRLRNEVALFENMDMSEIFVREMNKLISSNRFEQIYYFNRPGWLCVVTKPVHMRYNEISYSFGQYIIAFNCIEKRFQVFPYKNNILGDKLPNHYHPHVFESREICWGNASASYADLISQSKIGDLFLIADMIIHAYNPDSPVNTINYFNENRICPVARENAGQIYDLPIHLQTLMDWHPELEKDPFIFNNYKARYIGILNFVAEFVKEKEETIEDVEAALQKETQQPVAEVA